MAALEADYPGLAMHGVVGDFERHLHTLPQGGTRLVAFLGSTIGNLDPDGRAAFYAEWRAGLVDGDTLLLGTDLVKDERRLVAAYDDAAGVTAEFNRNVLHVLRRELGAQVDPDDFEHVALWDADAERIEMRLRARVETRCLIDALGLDVTFAAGEELRTEILTKFRLPGAVAELAHAGFGTIGQWTDPAGDVALTLAQVDG